MCEKKKRYNDFPTLVEWEYEKYNRLPNSEEQILSHVEIAEDLLLKIKEFG